MLVFPSNPNSGDVFGQWMWDGYKWTRNAGGGALAALADVSITDPMQADMLTWNAAAEKWVNAPLPAFALSGLTDVALVSPSDGQLLAWNAAAQKWTNIALPTPITPTLAGLADTSLSSLAVGQALTFNGSAWTNSNTFAPININRSDRGTLFVAQDTGSGNQFAIDNSSSDYVRLDVQNTANGMILATQGSTRAIINNNGTVSVNPFSITVGTALDVYGSPGSWAEAITSVATGHGLYVRAGADSGTYCALFRDSTASTNFLRLMGDGSGGLARDTITWDSAGSIYARGVARCRYKPASTSRVNTTSISDDPDLYQYLAVGVYQFTFFIGLATNGASGTTPGFQFMVVFNGGYNGAGWVGNGVTDQVFATAYSMNDGPVNLNLWGSNNQQGFGGGLLVLIGSINVTSAGYLSIRWAQRVASGNQTTVCIGSSLTATQLN